MTEFVLVAGAWLGAAAWGEVAAELRTALRSTDGDHEVHALTLSGLADKQGIPAGQQTHVTDIVDAIDELGLRDVVLVGHSYSGIPVGQAAERIGARLNRVVFVPARRAPARSRPPPRRGKSPPRSGCRGRRLCGDPGPARQLQHRRLGPRRRQRLAPRRLVGRR